MWEPSRLGTLTLQGMSEADLIIELPRVADLTLAFSLCALIFSSPSPGVDPV